MGLDTATNGIAGHEYTVLFLGAHGIQRIAPCHQRAQFTNRRRRGLPGLGMLGRTELGDQPGISLVGLGAHQARRAKRLDLGGIDDADRKSGIGQVLGNGLPIAAGRFHAGVKLGHPLLVQPSRQSGKAIGGVVDDLPAHLAIWKPQGDIQLGFGDIDSEYVVFHLEFSRNPPCKCGLPTRSGQRYCPISRKRNGKSRRDIYRASFCA